MGWTISATSVTGPLVFPDTTTTGVESGTTLIQVPADATSGDGWTWNSSQEVVVVTGDGATVDGIQISNAIIDVRADDVTISNCKINCAGTGVFGIALRSVNNCHITHCEIGGTRPGGGLDADGTGRLQYGIKDILSDGAGTEIDHCLFYDTANSISLSTANIHDNLIHNMGFVESDHIDCVLAESAQDLIVHHNTLLNEQGQTACIAGYTQSGAANNVTVTNNLMAGGGYCEYGGDDAFGATNVTIMNNYISTRFYDTGGQFGPFTAIVTGTTFSGNVWYDGDLAGQEITVT